MTTDMEKRAFGLNSSLLKALGIGAAGAGAAGLGMMGGHELGKQRYQPAMMQLGPASAIGPHYALEELQDDLQNAAGPEDYEDAFQEAENDGVMMLRTAGVKTAAERGQHMAREFVREMSKIAAVCAYDLYEIGMLSPEVAEPFVRGEVPDVEKMANLFTAVGIATAMADSENPTGPHGDSYDSVKTAAPPLGIVRWLQQQLAGASKGVGFIGSGLSGARQALQGGGTKGNAMDAFGRAMKGNWGDAGRAAIPALGTAYMGGKAVGGLFGD